MDATQQARARHRFLGVESRTAVPGRPCQGLSCSRQGATSSTAARCPLWGPSGIVSQGPREQLGRCATCARRSIPGLHWTPAHGRPPPPVDSRWPSQPPPPASRSLGVARSTRCAPGSCQCVWGRTTGDDGLCTTTRLLAHLPSQLGCSMTGQDEHRQAVVAVCDTRHPSDSKSLIVL